MSNVWQERYLKMLDEVCQRPGMWLGFHPTLRQVHELLSGYELGLSDAGCSPEMNGWFQWVGYHFNIHNPAWSSSRIIVHSLGSQEAGIAALPNLVRQFLNEREVLGGIEGLEAAIQRRFADGLSCDAAPESTFTTTND